MKSKIAPFCNVENRLTSGARCSSDLPNPLASAQEKVDALVLKYLHLQAGEADLERWREWLIAATTQG